MEAHSSGQAIAFPGLLTPHAPFTRIGPPPDRAASTRPSAFRNLSSRSFPGARGRRGAAGGYFGAHSARIPSPARASTAGLERISPQKCVGRGDRRWDPGRDPHPPRFYRQPEDSGSCPESDRGRPAPPAACRAWPKGDGFGGEANQGVPFSRWKRHSSGEMSPSLLRSASRKALGSASG